MKGTKAYKNKYINKIEKTIELNKERKYIKGFYYFLKNSNLNELSSQYNYILHIIRFMNSVEKEPNELTFDDYSIYLAEHENNSSSYRIVMYASLKKFSEYLYASKINTDNPMQFIKRPKYIEKDTTKEKREKGYLTKYEIRKIENAIECGVGSDEAKHKQESWKDRDKAIIYLFLCTGIRLSALYSLDVKDINLELKEIKVREKGSKFRQIKINQSMCDTLHRWIIKRNYIMRNEEEEALFISNRKKRMSTQTISNIVEKYGSVIVGKHITAHKLRHTFGTQIYNATKDINLTKNALGHSNVQTTQLYINGKDTQSLKIAETIENIIY